MKTQTIMLTNRIRKTARAFSALAIISLFSFTAAAQPASRRSWNEGWTFSKDGLSRTLNLPHDWGVDGPFTLEYDGSTGKLEWWGDAEYSKTLDVSANDLATGKRFFLDIDGAMSFSKVYCNDKLAGEWPYGYASYQVDLTPFLKEGANNVKVTINNLPNSSRWYPGGGIYRNVWLTKSDPVGVAHWGVFVSTSGENLVTKGENGAKGSATANIRTTLRDALGSKAKATVITTIFNGETILGEASSEAAEVTDGSVVCQSVELKDVPFWDTRNRNLLTARTIVNSGDYRDTTFTTFGVRTIDFRQDGFYLNGEKTFLKGVCLHHDSGALGAVWNTSVWTRRLRQLKDMGCNAIRTSHNPPAPELLDLCDEMGFLVMDELTDTWSIPKRPNGYALLFDEWAEKDMRALIRRDRNHPSVILWSVGNEVPEQGYPEKYALGFNLSVLCHTEDPTRLTSGGCDNPRSYLSDFRNTMDVFGFNYKPHLYEDFEKRFPWQPYLGSETSSSISSRGVYMFPLDDDKDIAEANFHVSSYDLHAVPWGQIPELEWQLEDKNPSCAGEFVWTGFDYIGEPTPYNDDMTVLSNFHDPALRAKAEKEIKEKGKIIPPSRSSYFGIIDLAGFPKDRYYLYKAHWTDEPVLHVLPHWNWAGREGEVTPVHVYTNLDKVALFVNGKPMGEKTREKGQYRLRWDDVVYEPGVVEARGYIGGQVFTEVIRTAGKASKVELTSERGVDGDLVFVTAKLTDSKGNFAPTACDHLRFSVSGPAEIVAVDAGDPTCLTPFKSSEIDAFNGLCSVIIRPTGKGKVSLTVRGDRLKTSRINL